MTVHLPQSLEPQRIRVDQAVDSAQRVMDNRGRDNHQVLISSTEVLNAAYFFITDTNTQPDFPGKTELINAADILRDGYGKLMKGGPAEHPYEYQVLPESIQINSLSEGESAFTEALSCYRYTIGSMG